MSLLLLFRLRATTSPVVADPFVGLEMGGALLVVPEASAALVPLAESGAVWLDIDHAEAVGAVLEILAGGTAAIAAAPSGSVVALPSAGAVAVELPDGIGGVMLGD